LRFRPYGFWGRLSLKHFEDGLLQAFSQIQKAIPPHYPLTVYYAFKQQELVVEEGTASTGWETMLTGLVNTGFQVSGTWPMRTELTTQLKKNVKQADINTPN